MKKWAYYNEIDKYAAQWLRNLIKAGYIAPGEVDERSIEDVTPDEVRNFAQCHWFSGVGVWSLALRDAGWADDRPIWTGSCPCQPFSAAGAGAGFADERHLWPAFHHLIAECRPAVVAGEQVASKAVDPWIDLVQDDLEALGYAVGAVAFPSAGVGAPHIRDRTYWVADAAGAWRCGRPAVADGGYAELGGPSADVRPVVWPQPYGSERLEPLAGVLSPPYGTPGRVGQLRAYGNAINKEAARVFIECAFPELQRSSVMALV